MAEGAQQQLGLVEPRSVGRCEQHAYLGSQLVQEGQRVGADVAGGVVDDQMHLLDLGQRRQVALDCRAKVGAVGALQAVCPHLSIVQGHARQQVHRAMTMILKLVSLDLPGQHQLLGRAAFQHLDVRLFVQTGYHFTPLP